MKEKTPKKRIEKRREEREDLALNVVLDQGTDPDPSHFWAALLVQRLRRASESADKLSRRVVVLNWILIILGGLSLFVAAYGVLCN
jgi:hypothetical protein